MENSIIEAALLGAVQGVAEFLPISSSAHLLICSWAMNNKPLPLVVNISFHLGTTTAVLLYFWKDWTRMGRASFVHLTTGARSFESATLLPSLMIGSVPAGVIGILWQDDIERLFHNPTSTILPLALVGILIWWADKRCQSIKKLTDLRFLDSFLIGCAQAAALIPGVSRSGATILVGRLLKFHKDDAARFSFLLGTPAMAGAALLNHHEILKGIQDPIFYVGFLSSCLVGMFAIGFLLRFIRTYSFLVFAIYRVILAGLIAIFMT